MSSETKKHIYSELTDLKLYYVRCDLCAEI